MQGSMSGIIDEVFPRGPFFSASNLKTCVLFRGISFFFCWEARWALIWEVDTAFFLAGVATLSSLFSKAFSLDLVEVVLIEI